MQSPKSKQIDEKRKIINTTFKGKGAIYLPNPIEQKLA